MACDDGVEEPVFDGELVPVLVGSDWCGTGVTEESVTLVWLERAWVFDALQELTASVLTGQSTNKQPIALVAAFQSSSRPAVRSLQALVISETTTPGKFSMSDTIAPLPISLKTLAASVMPASATLTI